MNEHNLKSYLESWKSGQIGYNHLLDGLEKYYRSQNSGKPMLGGAQPEPLPQFRPNDVDGAYFLGVFNTGGIEGLQRELNRIKELNFLPHQLMQLLKNSGNDR